MKNVRLNKITRQVIVDNIMKAYDKEHSHTTAEFFGVPKHRYEYIQNLMKLVSSTEYFKTSLKIVEQAKASGIRMRTQSALDTKGLPSGDDTSYSPDILQAKVYDDVTGAEKLCYVNWNWDSITNTVKGTDLEGNKSTLKILHTHQFPNTDGYFLQYDVNSPDLPSVKGIHTELKQLIKSYRAEDKEYKASREVFDKARTSLLEKITNQLNSVNTTKQLEEQWPEVIKFVPDSIIKPSTGIMLPMAQLDEVNDVLKTL